MTGLRLPPLSVLVASLALAILGVVATLHLAWQQPWLGVDLAVAEDGPGLAVTALAAAGPAAGALEPGRRLVALYSPDGALPLTAGDLLEEPDFLRDYGEYNAFLAKQGRIYRALQRPEVSLATARGEVISLRPAAHRPMADWPPAFWFQLIFAVACLGIGAAVWAFQRSTAAALFALTGLGLFVVGLTAAVYSTRELALGAPDFRILAAANHGGGMLFAGAFLGMLWYYPRPLSAWPFAAASIAVFAGIWILDVLQWLPSVDAGFRIPLLAGMAVTVALGVVQWRRLRSPQDRAALRWLLFTLLFGSSLFLGAMFVPVLAGGRPLLPQSYAFALLLLIYAGIALGVARYRLFSLERWWYPALAGSVALAATLAMLPLLVQVSDLSQLATLFAAIGILGWVYFPLRRWLAGRVTQRWRERTAPVLAEAVNLMLSPQRPSDIESLWRSLLEQIFAPLQVETLTETVTQIEVSADGARLRVPATEHTPALSLQWPARGARLFDPADLRTLEALLPLVGSARNLRAAWESGAAAERARIKRDLEDDLAPRLYGQILRAADPGTAAGARAALAEVRLLIDQLGSGEVALAEALAEWRAQIEDLCDLAGVPLTWRQPEDLPDLCLGPQARGNPLRILREAVTNAIDHARPTYMEVALTLVWPDIVLSVSHDGVDLAPEQWQRGRGLLNIQARAQQLAGGVQWSKQGSERVSMRARLSLEPAQ